MSRAIGTILVGTSLSPASDQVVRNGLLAARAIGARLHLAHAFEPPVLYDGSPMSTQIFSPEMIEAHRVGLRRRLASQIARLGASPGEIAGTTLKIGAPHYVLSETAASLKAGLIVIGATEGSARLAKLLGSTADRVVRRAACPLLVTRGELVLPPARVLVPVDLSSFSAEALRVGLGIVAEAIARRLGGWSPQVEALYVLDEAWLETAETEAFSGRTAEATSRLASFVADHRPERRWKITCRVDWGRAGSRILECIDELRPDLVVVGTHGRGGFERLLVGSVAGEVIHYGKCSVLVVPPLAACASSLRPANAAQPEPVRPGPGQPACLQVGAVAGGQPAR
jgi:universal stress protein E